MNATAPFDDSSSTPSLVRSDSILTRRQFLKTALASSALTVGASKLSLASDSRASLVDVNVTLSRSPMRRVRGDDTSTLVDLLRAKGVTQAWAGNFDGVLHKDIAAANARLALECKQRGRGRLLPIGSINPKLPDWETDLRRCVEEHRMPGIRLHPNYHGYALNDPDFVRLLRLAADRRLIVQIAVVMEDERMMHPLLRVEPVDTSPLPAIVKETPGARVVLLNALRTLRGRPLNQLVTSGQVCVEIAMLEGIGGVENLLHDIPPERLLFGSHAPLFYFESALLKLKESPLSPGQLRAIRSANAERLLTRNG